MVDKNQADELPVKWLHLNAKNMCDKHSRKIAGLLKLKSQIPYFNTLFVTIDVNGCCPSTEVHREFFPKRKENHRGSSLC